MPSDRDFRDPVLLPSGRVEGEVRPPSSKSLTHRYLALGLLSGRPFELRRPLVAEDTILFFRALRCFGWGVELGRDRVVAAPGVPADREVVVECGNAGTLLRFLVALATVLPGRCLLDGTPRLRERPVTELVEALRSLGAEIEYLGEPGFVPLRVVGGTLRGGSVRLDASSSSQYVSGLLLAASGATDRVEIVVEQLRSRPYVDLTLRAIGSVGGRIETVAPGRFLVTPGDLEPPRVEIEGDYSAACYPAAGAALTGGRVRFAGLRPDSAQGDRTFLDLLVRMGAGVTWEDDRLVVSGSGALVGLAADLGDVPDQVPTLAAIGPFARGGVEITGVPHLRIKESDRLAVMARELGRVGAPVTERAAGLVMAGTWAEDRPPSDPVVVEPDGDHRIAMSLAVTALRRPGLSVATPEVVAKSYPAFWGDWERLVVG